MLNWLTKTARSGARSIGKGKGGFFDVRGVAVPTAVSVFLTRRLSSSSELDGAGVSRLIHFNKLAKGGHFAAWE